MRTMASVCFMVVVLITINGVFGNTCSSDLDIKNCNECLRCGYNWCNLPGNIRCASEVYDDWCSIGIEPLPYISTIDDVDRTDVQPIYAERVLTIEKTNTLEIKYIADNPRKPRIQIANTTQSLNINFKVVDERTNCEGKDCVAVIEATARQDFCSNWGGIDESVYAQIYIGNYSKAVIVKYHVPCACACTLNVTKSSPHCGGHGDYSCGRCECHSEWTGEFCETLNCPENRGDVQCMDSSRMDVNCFGNGYCARPCDRCVCYKDREGSQYFDEADFCSDLCTITSDCDICLLNNTVGYCAGCVHNNIKFIPYNVTAKDQRDLQNRKVWMKCNLTVMECPIEYMAMRDEEDQISVMIVHSCNDKEFGATGAAVSKVPIILGVLAVLAVIMAAAGVMVWKHMNPVPPLPLNDSQYQNIGAEDCQYQNPLYVSPKTSFNNPMYGKDQ